MIDKKNRYGRTAARIHDADGLARRPSSVTIDIHAHIVVPQAAKLALPHVDPSRIPLAHFADAATREISAQQEKDIAEVMTTIVGCPTSTGWASRSWPTPNSVTTRLIRK
jgi:aminocarboxymuconate-semialdehyde decarboxylase